MSLNEVVNVTIDRQTQAVSQAGFGTVLLLGKSATWTERYRIYSGIAGVEADFPSVSTTVGGVTTTVTPPELVAARVAFSQSPAPTRLVIGRRGVVSGVAEDADIALSAIIPAFDDFYGVILLDRTATQQVKVANWVESKRKLFVTASADAAIAATAYPSSGTVTPASGDLAGQLRVSGLNRTAVMYFGALATTDWPDVAWLARQLSTAPGTETWMFKRLAGVSAAGLTTTASANARSKNATTYETIGGVAITREGKVASGEYLDVMHGVDWLQARLTERVFSRLVNLPKVPYTDAGVAIFESEIRAQLATAVEVGVLAGQPTVTVPRVRDVSPNDRANRFLPDIRFTATLAGAVHSVTVHGVVTV